MINIRYRHLILDRYLKLALYMKYKTNFIERSDYYNFSCNVCGDADGKKRGFILKNKMPWVYYCHRVDCNANMTANNWLKLYFPNQYREYRREINRLNEDDTQEIITQQLEKYRIKKEVEKKKEITNKKIKEIKEHKQFFPVLKGQGLIFDKAKSFIDKRKIPESIWKKWYVCTDGKYRNRLIIPFWDDNNKIYYYQGRALLDHMTPKYLSRNDGSKKAIYNIYNINKEKEVIVVEGPIDSMFLENSIAILGANISKDIQKKLNVLNSYYLFDNDAAGYYKSLELLSCNKPVFLWKKYLRINKIFNKIKDINDLYLYQNKNTTFSFNELLSYFSTSIHDRIYLK